MVSKWHVLVHEALTKLLKDGILDLPFTLEKHGYARKHTYTEITKLEDAYIEEKIRCGAWTVKTYKLYKAQFTLFRRIVGKTYIEDVTHKDIALYKQTLFKIPTNMNKYPELQGRTIQQAKKEQRNIKLFDGKGLYLDITKAGGTRWRFKYQFDGKEKLISLGLYPEISLKNARELHFEARTKVAKGINPSDERKAIKETKNDTNSFEAVTKEWWERNKHTWSEDHGYQIYRRLELNAFPWIGNKQISKITAPEVLKHLRRIEERGAIEMAHRVKGNVAQVMRYAVSTGRAKMMQEWADYLDELRIGGKVIKAKFGG